MLMMGIDGWSVISTGTATAFDPSKKGNINLTNSNLTATWASGGFESVLSVTGHSTGKFFCKFTIVASSGSILVGFANASEVLTGSPGYIGGTDRPGGGAGYQQGNTVFGNNVSPFGGNVLANYVTYTTGDVISMALNLTDALVWWRVNAGNWNNNASADPATNTLGLDISSFVALGPFFAGVTLAGSGDSVTADFSGAGAPGGGYVAW